MQSWNRVERWTFFSLILLAAGLRAYTLTSQPFWSDEWYTLKMVSQPTLFQDILMILVTDFYPPFFYVMTWIGVRLGGEGVFFLRLISLLGGVAAVGMVYVIARRWTGQRAALYAGLLAAFSPLGVYYAQEFKLYSFFAATTLWTLYEALVCLEREDRSWKRLALATAVSMYTYYLAPYFLLPLFSAAAWAWRQGWRKQAKHAATGLAVGMLAALPLLPFFVKAAMMFTANFWDKGKHLLLWYTAQNFSTGFVAPEALAWAAAALFAALVACNLLRRGAEAWAVAVMAAFAILPSAVQWVQSELLRPSYSDRAMLGSAYAWALCAGLGAAWLPRRLGRLCLLLALSINAYSLGLHYNPDTRSRYDYQATYEALKIEWRPGDAVFHSDLQSLFPFCYYAREDHSGMQNWSKVDDPGFNFNTAVQGGWRYWRPVNEWLKERNLGIDAGLDPAYVFPPRLDEVALKGAKRVWLVAPSGPVLDRWCAPILNLKRNAYSEYKPVDPQKQDWLSARGFSLQWQGEMSPGVMVYRFDKGPRGHAKA